MTGNSVKPLDRADFLRLASVCGLRLSPTDLFQLERHKLLCALDVGEGSTGIDPDGTYYSALHLYVLATYLDGVRAYRHPWASISGEREYDEVELDVLGARCRELDGIIRKVTYWVAGVGEGGEALDSQVVAEFARDIERYAHGIDPFGPLSGIVDMMRADVVDKLRGTGRLYGEFRRMAAGLAEIAEQLAVPEPVSSTGVILKATTREMVGVGFDGVGSDGADGVDGSALAARADRVSEPPTIAISIDEVPVDDVRRTQLIERMEGAGARSEHSALASDGADSGLEDPIDAALSVGLGAEKGAAHGFGREGMATSRTMDLNARLERLRNQDRAVAARSVEHAGASEEVEDSGQDVSGELDISDVSDVSGELDISDISDVSGELDISDVLDVSGGSEDSGPVDLESDRWVEVGLDDALSEALDSAVEDVLGGDLDDMLGSVIGDVDEGADTARGDDEDLGEEESDAVLLDNALDEDVLETAEYDAVLLEDVMGDGVEVGGAESDVVLLDNALEEDVLVTSEFDAVVMEDVSGEGESSEGGATGQGGVLEGVSDYSPEEQAKKIGELNRLREEYLATQSWSQLVDLYEHGIGLFVDSEERQQVYLVLATLYELKLKHMGRAMDSFIRAFGEVGNRAGTDKALAGIRRLGPLPEVHEDYLTDLEEQLAGELTDEDRHYLQRFHALALYGAGQYQRAFLLYASMMAESPNTNVDPQSLGDLEMLAAEVDIEELLDFYHDILEQNVRPEIRQWIQERVEAL